jgi:hypothetical protein
MLSAGVPLRLAEVFNKAEFLWGGGGDSFLGASTKQKWNPQILLRYLLLKITKSSLIYLLVVALNEN